MQQNLIERILEIDKSGVKRVEDANAKARAILDEANEKKAEMERRFNERIQTRLSTVEEDCDKIAAEDIAEITLRKQKLEALIDSIMAEKGAEWEKEILDRIIG